MLWGSRLLSTDDPFDESRISYRPPTVAAEGAWRAEELGRGRSVSLSSLQSGGVHSSRVARHEASARSAALRRCVLREDTSSTGRRRYAGAGVIASGDLDGEAGKAFDLDVELRRAHFDFECWCLYLAAVPRAACEWLRAKRSARGAV